MTDHDPQAEAWLAGLASHLGGRRQVVVALSGGVDSSVLAAAAVGAVGPGALAVTVHYESFPERERAQARRIAAEVGIRHLAVADAHLDDPHYAANGPDRCFLCRGKVAAAIQRAVPDAAPRDILFGVNASDLEEVRPGIAATRQAGFGHPYLDLGLDKAAVRAVASLLGLSSADRPSMACLSSRFPPGMPIAAPMLATVDEMERRLLGLGFTTVRFRLGGAAARLEMQSADIPLAEANARTIAAWSRELGLPQPVFALYRPAGSRKAQP